MWEYPVSEQKAIQVPGLLRVFPGPVCTARSPERRQVAAFPRLAAGKLCSQAIATMDGDSSFQSGSTAPRESSGRPVATVHAQRRYHRSSFGGWGGDCPTEGSISTLPYQGDSPPGLPMGFSFQKPRIHYEGAVTRIHTRGRYGNTLLLEC